MAIPRRAEDSNKQMRNAAIARLRSEYGVTLSKKNRAADGIAHAIRQIEPALQSDDPMVLIRAWVALKPEQAVPARLLTETGRVYQLSKDKALNFAVSRLRDMRMPSPVSMSSKVPYSPEFA